MNEPANKFVEADISRLFATVDTLTAGKQVGAAENVLDAVHELQRLRALNAELVKLCNELIFEPDDRLRLSRKEYLDRLLDEGEKQKSFPVANADGSGIY